jgi:hypothetical protein
VSGSSKRYQRVLGNLLYWCGCSAASLAISVLLRRLWLPVVAGC